MSTSTRTDRTISTGTSSTDSAIAPSPTELGDLRPEPRRAGAIRRRWTESPVLFGVTALAAGGLLAVAVAATVVVLTRQTPAGPKAAPAVATVEGPSTGDARQGLTADAATRRLGGSSAFSAPDSADSAMRRAVAAAGLYAWDSADSAYRRASTAATWSTLGPDSADPAARRNAAAEASTTTQLSPLYAYHDLVPSAARTTIQLSPSYAYHDLVPQH